MDSRPDTVCSQPWYVAGLAFECLECGNCCAGPQEGYVWVDVEEIVSISKFLEMNERDFIKLYTRKARGKKCLRETKSHDCVFLEDGRCAVYPVRPSQCRTWPFWSSNLHSPDDWCEAGKRCPGINRGKIHSLEYIQKVIHHEPE